jgi:ribose transport system ATP-binding protein
VYQEPELCAELTVAESVLLGGEPARYGVIDRSTQRERALASLRRVVPEDNAQRLAPERLIKTLSPSERQLVALARALAHGDCRVLILDEPTSALSAADVARLFDVVADLAASGITVLYISHFLEEVERVATRFTMLRDGRSVASGDLATTTRSELVALMAGRAVSELFPRSPRVPGEPVLELAALRGTVRPSDASLTLRRGEVLGIAGLLGSGRTALLRAIFGLDAVRGGTLRVKALSGPRSPAERLRQGVGLLSEDRKGEGLADSMSLGDNLTLSKLDELGPLGLVLPARRDAATQRYVTELGIRCRGPEQLARELSGGNQQKLCFARLLHHGVDVLLLDEPTRGIDVGSRADIYRLIDGLAAKGAAILLVSSYLPELLGVCDRVAVMVRGRLATARPVTELSEHALLLEATG